MIIMYFPVGSELALSTETTIDILNQMYGINNIW